MSGLSGFVTTSVVISEDGLDLQENRLTNVPAVDLNIRSETLAQQLDRRKKEIEAERDERNRNLPPAPLDEDDIEFIAEQERNKRLQLYNSVTADLDELQEFKIAQMSRSLQSTTDKPVTDDLHSNLYSTSSSSSSSSSDATTKVSFFSHFQKKPLVSGGEKEKSEQVIASSPSRSVFFHTSQHKNQKVQSVLTEPGRAREGNIQNSNDFLDIDEPLSKRQKIQTDEAPIPTQVPTPLVPIEKKQQNGNSLSNSLGLQSAFAGYSDSDSDSDSDNDNDKE